MYLHVFPGVSQSQPLEVTSCSSTFFLSYVFQYFWDELVKVLEGQIPIRSSFRWSLARFDSVENLCTIPLPKVEVQIGYELLSGPCMIVCSILCPLGKRRVKVKITDLDFWGHHLMVVILFLDQRLQGIIRIPHPHEVTHPQEPQVTNPNAYLQPIIRLFGRWIRIIGWMSRRIDRGKRCLHTRTQPNSTSFLFPAAIFSTGQ